MKPETLVKLVARINALEYVTQTLLFETAKNYGDPAAAIEAFAKQEREKLDLMPWPDLGPVGSDMMAQEVSEAFDNLVLGAAKRIRNRPLGEGQTPDNPG